jgi:hypothetical protein
MSRYVTNRILQDKNGKRYYDTIILPVPAQSSDDIYIQTTAQDRLDKLAYIFYEDETLWWVIATANGLGKGTYIVPANTRLRIPSNPNIQTQINNTNSER